ncbi:MAG: hypothetical protein J6S67_21070 [Methanobrevibacter sp.]|nr:hypothetical protein [Methanobrevibacter sp.]
MNGKTAKKIRKEINSSLNKKLNEKEKEIANQIYDLFNSKCFKERVKIAWKIICKKL